MTKESLLSALETFVCQRPGFEFGNYGDRASYMSDVRRATRDLHHARALIRWARLSSVPYDVLAGVMTERDRLSWNGARVEYCTGQYWPVEYRAAVIDAMRGAMREFAFAHCRANDGEDVRKYMRDSLPGPVFRRIW
jgi:hypothetical protein